MREQTRVLHLNQSMRSGSDPWFSRLLDTCREGAMLPEDYNFLHGFPTACSVDVNCVDAKCSGLAAAVQKAIRDKHRQWSGAWAKCKQLECDKCKAERKRRTRVWAVHVLEACLRVTHRKD